MPGSVASRRGEQARGRSLEAAPDPRPAIRLRESLARHREHGMPFEAAFRAGLYVALRGLPVKQRGGWRIAFEETEDAWRDAYYGIGKPLRLSRPE